MGSVDLICIKWTSYVSIVFKFWPKKKKCTNITTIIYIKLREVEFLPGVFL